MPIENIETGKNNNEMVLHAPIFSSSNVVVAGQIKVKHPLMDKSLILYGFVIEDQYFNENDFRVQGMNISYLYEDKYRSENPTIYPKIMIDKKQTLFFNLFNNLEVIYLRNTQKHELYTNDDGDEYCLFEYYMFDKIHSLTPKYAANEIYAVCKYIEEGGFKYKLFSFHELMPES